MMISLAMKSKKYEMTDSTIKKQSDRFPKYGYVAMFKLEKYCSQVEIGQIKIYNDIEGYYSFIENIDQLGYQVCAH